MRCKLSELQTLVCNSYSHDRFKNNMKDLKINITKATIEQFTVTLGEDKPEISASIALRTEGGKKITSYSISTDSYNEVNKFELPNEMLMPIMLIAQELENIVVGHCKTNQKLLE